MRDKEKHAKKRFRERFGFSMNRNKLAELKAQIISGRAQFLYANVKHGHARTAWMVEIKKSPLRMATVIYCEFSRRIVTVMRCGRTV